MAVVNLQETCSIVTVLSQMIITEMTKEIIITLSLPKSITTSFPAADNLVVGAVICKALIFLLGIVSIQASYLGCLCFEVTYLLLALFDCQLPASQVITA